MVAIRNRNTNVPHVFRYPMWEEDIFYPAGSLAAYPVPARTDSDQAYFDFYVAKIDVEASDNTPPPDSFLKWKLIMSTSSVGDSEINAALLQLDSEIALLNAQIQILIDQDSDFHSYLDSEVRERIKNDSDIQFIKHAIISRDSEWDSDLLQIHHDYQSADSELIKGIDSDLQALKDHDSDFKVSYDSDLLQIHHDYQAADSDLLAQIEKYVRDSDLYVRTIYFGDNDSEGVLEWNTAEGTLDLKLSDNVTLQIGQEQVFYGKAQGAIANGDVVMFAGAQGDHLLFTKADVTIPNFRDEYVIGVATQNLNNNDFGYVTVQGKVRDLNTSNFNEGSLLWLDPTEAGRLIDSEPVAPLHSILIAAVTRSHNNHGTIFVRPTLGKTLKQHHDVRIDNIQDRQVLMWNDSEQVWVNIDLANVQVGGYDYGYF